jgi:hypothetical protein
MRLDLIPVDSLTRIAWALADAHGDEALGVADRTIRELESKGSPVVADAWRGLRSVLEDVLGGRLGRDTPTIH